jgi:hypothetical protein
MEEKAILIHFDTATGEFKLSAEGFEGLSCLEATQPFEEALGIVGERTYKPEAEVQQHRSNSVQLNQQSHRW